ncbi:MAG: hypothetical protein IKH99_01685 [Prevotella sp.]|nr:hypothetical protein [Prevotella sp.]
MWAKTSIVIGIKSEKQRLGKFPHEVGIFLCAGVFFVVSLHREKKDNNNNPLKRYDYEEVDFCSHSTVHHDSNSQRHEL